MPAATQPTQTLFRALKVGQMALKHRVAMAPLTRYRADSAHAHTDLAVEYYAQRASAPGTLLVTEATLISQRAGGYDNVPGIYTDAQIAAWKRVTDAVHAKGSYIYLQLWALGRTAEPAILEREGGNPYVSASSVSMTGKDRAPRPLSIPEIKSYVSDYAAAARRAVHDAGFDGVEIHGANGYLLDQFWQDVSNQREDAYGGSVENRARFGMDIVKAVSDAVGADRTAVRLSPWGTFQDMGMKDPVPQFSYIVEKLKQDFPDLAYLHFVEPLDSESASNAPFQKIWEPKPILLAGGFKRTSALKTADEVTNAVVVFGRDFIANPDLPRRLRDDLSLNAYDRKTFYIAQSPKGYIDYPFYDEVTH